MTQYSYAQLEQLWINAGGSRSLAPVMAAIAEAESGGQSTANNYTDNGGTQTSWGLWQISNGTHSMPVANIDDPTVNAQAAVAKYKSQGLGAWGTYTSGAYLAFLNGSTSPDPNVPAGSSGTGTAADLTAAHNDCLWFITYPGGNVGGWIGGALGAATGQGGAGLAAPAAGQGGGTCLFSKGEARAFLGGLMLVGGSVVLGVGVLILTATAFAKTGGLNKAADVAAIVPGGQPIAAGLHGAAARTSRGGGARAARNQSAAEARRRRQRDRDEAADAQAGG